MALKGKLFGIGVGPGDSELLTLKAVRVLQNAGVVFVPKGEKGQQSQALSIIAPFLKAGQEVRELMAPMTRERANWLRAWDDAAGEIIQVLDEGRNAVFVTIGDSVLYSTYYYLCEALRGKRPDLAVETIPGITSYSAAAALLNRALAVGQESLAVIPATNERDYLRQVLISFNNVVLMKVSLVLEDLLDLLSETGRLDEAVYVSKVGMPGQYVREKLTAGEKLPRGYFSLILVGKLPALEN